MFVIARDDVALVIHGDHGIVILGRLPLEKGTADHACQQHAAFVHALGNPLPNSLFFAKIISRRRFWPDVMRHRLFTRLRKSKIQQMAEILHALFSFPLHRLIVTGLDQPEPDSGHRFIRRQGKPYLPPCCRPCNQENPHTNKTKSLAARGKDHEIDGQNRHKKGYKGEPIDADQADTLQNRQAIAPDIAQNIPWKACEQMRARKLGDKPYQGKEKGCIITVRPPKPNQQGREPVIEGKSRW